MGVVKWVTAPLAERNGTTVYPPVCFKALDEEPRDAQALSLLFSLNSETFNPALSAVVRVTLQASKPRLRETLSGCGSQPGWTPTCLSTIVPRPSFAWVLQAGQVKEGAGPD